MAKPVRTKDESHLIPDWQKHPLYIEFLKAKEAHTNAVTSGNEADIELTENVMREAQIALIEARVNQFSNFDWRHRGSGRGFYIG